MIISARYASKDVKRPSGEYLMKIYCNDPAKDPAVTRSSKGASFLGAVGCAPDWGAGAPHVAWVRIQLGAESLHWCQKWDVSGSGPWREGRELV